MFAHVPSTETPKPSFSYQNITFLVQLDVSLLDLHLTLLLRRDY